MTVTEGIVVRAATAADAPAIRDVAVRAWRATYAGRITDETIERFLALAYADERVARRIDRHEVLVTARDGTGAAVEAFAEWADRDDHLQLVSIYALPEARGSGLGSALIAEVIALHPGQDIAADVLEGNELAEPFYAARGFVPGEALVDEIVGEPVRERRWWLRASDGPGGR
jgi:GNAT superfamily N-acetyltransferase